MAIDKLQPEPTGAGVKMTQRLYRTKDPNSTTLVEEGDPEAAFLFCSPGQTIPIAEARKYGLVADGPVAGAKDPQAQAPGAKESQPAGTKEAAPEATKARKPKTE